MCRDGWVDKKSVSRGEKAPWLWLEATLYKSFQCGSFAPEMLVLGSGSPSLPSLAVSFTPCQ